MRGVLSSASGILLAAYLLDPVSACAADAGAAASRPRICLVLSGGAARGAAHVGVLKALERLHIPVDCIAGTSIGASVGGLYAAGMTTEELEQQLNRQDVQADMSNNTPRSRLSYKDKQDALKYLLQIEFGYGDGHFFFPQSIINGSDPDRILNVLTLTLQPDDDFDKLPIPFRAVATDIETGQMVVLDHGSLADAMLASMAVPSLYPPVRINGRLLVDGGLSRNLPVDVGRSLGADIIIAVNTGAPLEKADSLNDVFSVSLQVVKILGNQNVLDSIATLKKSDVLLSPDLGDIGATDFQRMGQAIKLGEQQAYAALKDMTELQLSPEAYARYRDRYRHAPLKPRRIDFVEVSGNDRISADLIRERFGVMPGAGWDVQAINQGMQRIYDMGNMQRVDAQVISKGGQLGLQLSVSEKSWQPNYLQFGLHIADDFEGDSSYELLGSYVRSEINDLGAEWRNEFEIGRTRLYYTELYQPLDYAGDIFIAPQVEYLNQTYDLFSGVDRIAEYSTVFPHAGMDLGWRLDNLGEARLGLLYGHVIAQPRIGDPALLPTYRNTLVGPRFKMGLDTFDSAGFPTSGSYVLLNGFFPRRSLGSDIAYSKVDLALGEALGTGSDSVLLLGEAGGDLGTTLPPYEQFTLGGFLSLAGDRQGQLRGDEVFDAHLIYTHHAYNLPTGLGKGLYLGIGLDAGNVWQNGQHASFGSLQYGAAAFIGADSVLGPLYLGIGVGRAGSRTFFLYLGIPINGSTLAPSFGN